MDELFPAMCADAIRMRIGEGGAVRIKACDGGTDAYGVKRVMGM